MTSEQANAVLEKMIGQEVVIMLKTPGVPSPAGKLSKGAAPDMWRVSFRGLDPMQPPQNGAIRQIDAAVSADDVLYVMELGALSTVSPAAIARMPQGGPQGGPIFR